MNKTAIISRTVWVLSLVSLCTDIASEMLYPVMPVYLKEIGFSIAAIGILEGIAEAVAGLSKGYFGTWSDNTGKRMPFVRWGYGLSAISKPMMALLTYPWWIFIARVVDRTGKGLRTGARDAILVQESTPSTKARVFGFHRALDTTGALLGPSLSLLFLYYAPQQYRQLFLWAFIPGIIAVALTFLMKDTGAKSQVKKQWPSFKSFYQYWLQSPSAYKRLTGALLVFALFNSSDTLLLLKMKETGLSDTALIGVYIFYNGIYAILSYPLASIADKIGAKKILIAGMVLFSIVYAGMGIGGNIIWYLLLFLLYGAYAAATEGVSKAWIASIVPKENTAAALGTFSGFQSIAAFLASSIAGLIWVILGASFTFILSAVVSLLVVIYIYRKTT
ncbi:MFS transporter [Limnovirga soli]|uniref:MFS transporter n=1 Tax=Limnovirga soli TaxID=2656915 RepID=A0A8J8FMD1_9BACT|nr:MFS transporter [Limnovirga soli]NNV57534.1 MFS transporter [Limnovirga soli]